MSKETKTYVVLQRRSGKGIHKVAYAGDDEHTATLLAKKECGTGDVMPNKESIRYRYSTEVQVWIDGEITDSWQYTKNGHKVVDSQVIREDRTDVSSERGKI